MDLPEIPTEGPLAQPFHICPTACGAFFEEPDQRIEDGYLDLFCPECGYHFAHLTTPPTEED